MGISPLTVFGLRSDSLGGLEPRFHSPNLDPSKIMILCSLVNSRETGNVVSFLVVCSMSSRICLGGFAGVSAPCASLSHAAEGGVRVFGVLFLMTVPFFKNTHSGTPVSPPVRRPKNVSGPTLQPLCSRLLDPAPLNACFSLASLRSALSFPPVASH